MSDTTTVLNRAGSADRTSAHASARWADTRAVEHATKKHRKGLAATIAAMALLALATGVVNQGNAQAKYTATRAGDLQVGGGFTFAKPDYTRDTFKGGMFYTTFDFKDHYGVELNFHQVNAGDGSKLYERTYEVGGRYVRHYGIFNPYAKLIYGRGVFNYPDDIANLAYNLGALGAGVDINVHPRINVRVDYEYQHWFGFRGNIQDNTSSALSPQLLSIGAAYHFH